MTNFLLLADNDAANEWLKDNPAVLGGIAILIGLMLLAFGGNSIMTGKARTKWGIELTGLMARLHGGFLAVVGLAAMTFGLFKVFGG
ncbi:MAG: hypothetical protein KDA58_11965 [Planctomycetaceae bacterium]|nr:hypothetical protein [Planctomycetaceae bacterium]